ncbi:MAG: helix-turn-helix transcriptional regulator [Anaerorhabdus sp.]
MAITKKNKLLYLITLFTTQSDEQHPISMSEILTYLNKLNIQAERKSIYDDINLLQSWGMDILFTRSKKQGYYLASTSFDAVEIKIIVDMIASAEFISSKKSKELIQKCTSLLSNHQAKEIQQNLRLSTNKKENEHLFYSIHVLQEALNKKERISFQYFDYSFKNEKQYRKNATRYSLIPLTLIFENQRYYCIGYSEKYNNLTHYRVDKMDHVLLDGKADPIKKSTKAYIESTFKLTLGEVENVSIRFNNRVLHQVQDDLGQSLFIEKKTDDFFIINLSTSLSPTFISWILQFNFDATVLKPQKLINQLLDISTNIQKIYSTSL